MLRLLIPLALLLFPTASLATSLLFSELVFHDPYGDRVSGSPQDGFFYELSGGPTPNVEFSLVHTPFYGVFGWYGVGAGDLNNHLAWSNSDGSLLGFTLSADPGFRVHSVAFALASFGSDRIVDAIRVTDEHGALLYESTDVSVPSVGHLAVSFPAAITSRVLQVEIDASNLWSGSDEGMRVLGLDDVQFAQAVPEASVTLLWTSLLVGAWIRGWSARAR